MDRALVREALLLKLPLLRQQLALALPDLSAFFPQATRVGLEGAVGLLHEEPTRARHRMGGLISLAFPLGAFACQSFALDLELIGLLGQLLMRGLQLAALRLKLSRLFLSALLTFVELLNEPLLLLGRHLALLRNLLGLRLKLLALRVQVPLRCLTLLARLLQQSRLLLHVVLLLGHLGFSTGQLGFGFFKTRAHLCLE